MPAVAFTESEINRATKAATAAGMIVREVRIEKAADGSVTIRVLSDVQESVEGEPAKKQPEKW